MEDIAAHARVTTGALYHHFPTKAALFEAVFEVVHRDLFAASARAAEDASESRETIGRAFAAFLEAVLEPEVQRIVITDAPAVLGLLRFTQLDERYAFGAIVNALRTANDSGGLRLNDPETLARLLLGALSRGAMLIATSEDPDSTRGAVAAGLDALLAGLAPER